jgi:hypothetical protein
MSQSAQLHFFSAFLFLLFPILSFGQSGTITGVVRDAETGEVLIGASVTVVGTTLGASVDIEGRYNIRSVPRGIYELRFSMVGYTTQVVSEVRVTPDAAARLDVALKSSAVQMQEVVITARALQSTESAALATRKKAVTIGDAITIEQVKRTPDATAAEALRRVTGVSIVDNKFVFVRGVTDRYNSTTINGVGVTMTDTETDKKSFAFDMVPSNLVDNTTVVKSATPDLPGDFTGGLVQMQTLDFPDALVMKTNFSSGYSPFSNAKNFHFSSGSSTDWLGKDDGSRAEPNRYLDQYEIGRQSPNNWVQRSARAPLNLSVGISAGGSIPIGESEIGIISALSYRDNYSRNEIDGTWLRGGALIHQISGVKDVRGILWGSLFDVSFKSGAHKVSIRNSYTRTGEDKLGDFSTLDENQEQRHVQMTEWNQRGLYVGQLAGEHRFASLFDTDVRWRVSYTESHAQQPDRKISKYRKYVDAPPSWYVLEPAVRAWSYREEFGRSASFDLAHPVDFGVKALSGAKFKYGAFAETKERYFDIRVYIVDPVGGMPSQAFYPLDSAYAAEFYRPGIWKMYADRDALARDIYTGFQELYSGFALLDIPFTIAQEEFRVTGGVRMENCEIRVVTADPFQTTAPGAPRYTARVKNVDFLPSMNLVYKINSSTNLRLAYGHSVNRPEFRELAAFYFYDYTVFEGNYGNPFLRRALSKNADIRFEYFPDIGEVIAVSYFRKHISDAIEEKLLVTSGLERTWYNAPNGTNSGWEFEFRKSFGFISPYFQNLSFLANYNLVKSEIEYTVFEKINRPPTYPDTSYTRTREMQGQSPYTLNLSLSFTEPTLRTTFSALYYEFGRRLNAVAQERDDDVYEDARGALDASVIQPLWKGFELKATWKNIGDKVRSYTTRSDSPFRRIRTGTSYSLQISYSL